MHDPHPWASELRTLHAHAWALLTRGVKDRRADTRHLTLATVTRDHKPQARTVVMRAADKLAGIIEVHTDLRSAKVAELYANSCACLHFWDKSAHLQMRLEARVTVLTGDKVKEIWARVPDASRLAYGGTPAPGQSLSNALDYTKTPDPAAFVVLRFQIEAMDLLHLGPEHRRGRYVRAEEWAGHWLTP